MSDGVFCHERVLGPEAGVLKPPLILVHVPSIHSADGFAGTVSADHLRAASRSSSHRGNSPVRRCEKYTHLRRSTILDCQQSACITGSRSNRLRSARRLDGGLSALSRSLYASKLCHSNLKIGVQRTRVSTRTHARCAGLHRHSRKLRQMG